MKFPVLVPKQRIVFVAIFVLSACGVLAAQSPHAGDATYQWSAELVSYDDTARTVTVKARAVDQEVVGDLKRFKAGERVLLQWSGFQTYADGIRRVMPHTDSKTDERFLLPVELVSTDAPHQYVTFRLQVPAADLARLKSVRAGEWVTVTSSHRPSGEAAAVTSIRPYVTTSPGNTD
jgi:hypothetical protein